MALIEFSLILCNDELIYLDIVLHNNVLWCNLHSQLSNIVHSCAICSDYICLLSSLRDSENLCILFLLLFIRSEIPTTTSRREKGSALL